MDVAQDAVLLKGFEATSIDEIVAAVEISKGGFFYHFADKNALAQALIRRYIEEEDRIFDDLFGRAGELNDDPLHAMLIGLKMLAELFENLPHAHPGCLVATTAYQDRMFDAEVREFEIVLQSWAGVPDFSQCWRTSGRYTPPTSRSTSTRSPIWSWV